MKRILIAAALLLTATPAGADDPYGLNGWVETLEQQARDSAIESRMQRKLDELELRMMLNSPGGMYAAPVPQHRAVEQLPLVTRAVCRDQKALRDRMVHASCIATYGGN
jgi:hypothetical protein